jgi:hypothetical protein
MDGSENLTAAEVRQRLAGKTIWLWHYMHSDWQWEQSRHWHEERYALAVGEALDIMQQNPEFCYFFDNISEYFGAAAQRLGPRLDELKERVREGRIRIASGQVANGRPTQIADETYIRNIQLGREYFETHLPPTDLSLFHSVDIAIGGSQMPQVLSQLGFKYYRAWRPHGPMNVLGIPHQFVWQSPDGSEIIVTRGAYGGWLGDAPVNQDGADWDKVVEYVYRTFFHDQLLVGRSESGNLWMIQGADDSRPLRNWFADRPDKLEEFVSRWREREDVPIKWCTPLEFSQAVAAQREHLPVVRGALEGADCGYNFPYHGTNGLWSWRQMNDRRLVRAELWGAAGCSAGYATPEEELHRLWYQHCTYQAHAQEAAFENDWNFLVDRARDVKYHAERIQEDAQRAIVQAAGGGTRTTRYIFNPHPWPVAADVVIYHACATAGIESLQAVDENGKAFPQQQLREFRHSRFGGSVNDEDRLVRVDLPALGYRRVEIAESEAPAGGSRPVPPEDGVVQTGALRLFYRDHALREVRDLASGRAYSSREGAPWPCLFYHMLDHQDWVSDGPEVGRERFTPTDSQWLQCGPLRWHHRSIGMLGPYKTWLDTIVADQGREIQIAVQIDAHWETPPVTGFATLLAEIEAGGEMHVDTPFAVEARDPDHDLYVHDVAGKQDLGIVDMIERLRPGTFWGRSWADWSGRGQGVTMITADGHTYWFKEPQQFGHVLIHGMEAKAGTWEEFCAKSITGGGTHTFHYALRFHDGDWHQADPQHRAAELRHAPVVVRADYPSEPALPPVSHSFLEIAGPGMLSAYYQAGGDSIVRFYEHTGQGGAVRLTFDWSPVSAQVVDLLGNALDVPVQVSGNEVALNVKPWQIVTLKLGRG